MIEIDIVPPHCPAALRTTVADTVPFALAMLRPQKPRPDQVPLTDDASTVSVPVNTPVPYPPMGHIEPNRHGSLGSNTSLRVICPLNEPDVGGGVVGGDGGSWAVRVNTPVSQTSVACTIAGMLRQAVHAAATVPLEVARATAA